MKGVQMCQANGCTAEATTVAKWDLGDVMGTKSTVMVRHYCDDHADKVVSLAAGHGVWMTEEEYRVTGWHSRGTYTSGKGVTEHQWIAPMGGHILWAQQTWRNREQGIAAAQQRRANDDEYSAAVVAQIEEETR